MITAKIERCGDRFDPICRYYVTVIDDDGLTEAHDWTATLRGAKRFADKVAADWSAPRLVINYQL